MEIIEIVRAIEDKYGDELHTNWWLHPDFKGSELDRQRKAWIRKHDDDQTVYQYTVKEPSGKIKKYRNYQEVRHHYHYRKTLEFAFSDFLEQGLVLSRLLE